MMHPGCTPVLSVAHLAQADSSGSGVGFSSGRTGRQGVQSSRAAPPAPVMLLSAVCGAFADAAFLTYLDIDGLARLESACRDMREMIQENGAWGACVAQSRFFPSVSIQGEVLTAGGQGAPRRQRLKMKKLLSALERKNDGEESRCACREVRDGAARRRVAAFALCGPMPSADGLAGNRST